jgi:hypothetical protein
MPHSDRLVERFEALQRQPSHEHQRGRDFEEVVAAIFDRAGFDVVRNPAAARPRQTDLHAHSQTESYLIEAKWRTSAIGSGEVDDMLVRLRRVPGDVVGVIVSMAPISPEALRAVENERARPVLIVGPEEVARVVKGYANLRTMLRDKRTNLTVHASATDKPGAMLFAEPQRDKSEALWIVTADGKQMPWVSWSGGYNRVIWALDLPDIDWIKSGGAGVVLDLPVDVETLEDVISACRHLQSLDWLGHGAAWSIEQSLRTWSGFGVTSLLEALEHRDLRYEEISSYHHREILHLTDACPYGWYTLTADLDARSRRAWALDLSLQLDGIPLDLAPIHRLMTRLDVTQPVSFRPKTERSVERVRLPNPIEVDVSGWIVERDPRDPDDALVAKGVVFRYPTLELPISLPKDTSAIADLRSWHGMARLPDVYELRTVEWAWSSEALVVRAAVDWPGELAPVVD